MISGCWASPDWENAFMVSVWTFFRFSRGVGINSKTSTLILPGESNLYIVLLLEFFQFQVDGGREGQPHWGFSFARE